MDVKKSTNASLEDKKLVFMLIGLVFSLSVVFVALEWTKHDVTAYDIEDLDISAEDELDINTTEQNEPEPPQEQQQPEQPDVIEQLEIVDNNVQTEHIEISSETDENEVIQEIVKAEPVAAPVVEEQDDEIFVIVEKQPEFPGGTTALMQWLGQNIKYPVIAQENGIQGRVICQFVVNKDGSIVDVQVARTSGDSSLDKEAVRVINNMPKWKPGQQRGKAVRTKFTLPVVFKLQ